MRYSLDLGHVQRYRLPAEQVPVIDVPEGLDRHLAVDQLGQPRQGFEGHTGLFAGLHHGPDLLAGGGRGGNEDLLDLIVLHHPGQLRHRAQNRDIMNRAPLLPGIVVDKPDHMVMQAFLGRHLPEDLLAGGAGPDDEGRCSPWAAASG